jgi:GDPmannose 4,6-dehydratase
LEKVALITGIAGPDGSCLAELLLDKGYVVHGVKRRSSASGRARVDHLHLNPHHGDLRFFMHYGDMSEATEVIRIIEETQPTEIYNLSGQHPLQLSLETAEYAANADGLGTLRILEALRMLGMQKHTRFHQASTPELYGDVAEIPQTEQTPFRPRSAYAAARLYAYWVTVSYRERFSMHASNGILFNQEGPDRRITRGIAAIGQGLQQKVYVGNLDAKRDWGHARDYVAGMWMILQHDEPDDYVLATGRCHTVRELVERAFAAIGRTIAWRGTGAGEFGVDEESGETLVEVDPSLFGAGDAEILLGDPTKARERLGWRHRTRFEDVVRDMMEADMEIVAREQGGYVA